MMFQIWLLFLMPINDGSFIPTGPICPGIDYPAIMSVYDPSLGGINCDDDCRYVATGLLLLSMYEVAGACPAQLLGQTVIFPTLGHTLHCVDTGPAIRSQWSDRDNQCVTYFDTLWPLERVGNRIDGAPYWTWWLVDNWYISYNIRRNE